MTIKQLFEQFASDTWQRIQLSWEYNVSQGEETITDLLLLEIARHPNRNVHVVKTTKAQEAQSGLDWEWWIGDWRIGWLRFAIQAKKIGKSGRYDALKHKVSASGGRTLLQHNVLKRYAAENQAIPLYCLFNHAGDVSETDHWHCSEPFKTELLGCTLAPLHRIEEALRKRGCRTFDFIHTHPNTFPWHCLFCSENGVLSDLVISSRLTRGIRPTLYRRLPPIFQYAREADSEISLLPEERERDKALQDLLIDSRSYFNDNLQVYPRRILLIEQNLLDLSSEIEILTETG